MENTIKINIKAAVICWFLTIGYMILVFYFSSQNFPFILNLPPDSDKAIHFLIYAILAFLFYRSFKKSGVRKYILILSFVFATIYGISDEFHQSYVPGRVASIGDIFADSFGALVGTYLAKIKI